MLSRLRDGYVTATVLVERRRTRRSAARRSSSTSGVSRVSRGCTAHSRRLQARALELAVHRSGASRRAASRASTADARGRCRPWPARRRTDSVSNDHLRFEVMLGGHPVELVARGARPPGSPPTARRGAGEPDRLVPAASRPAGARGAGRPASGRSSRGGRRATVAASGSVDVGADHGEVELALRDPPAQVVAGPLDDRQVAVRAAVTQGRHRLGQDAGRRRRGTTRSAAVGRCRPSSSSTSRLRQRHVASIDRQAVPGQEQHRPRSVARRADPGAPAARPSPARPWPPGR